MKCGTDLVFDLFQLLSTYDSMELNYFANYVVKEKRFSHLCTAEEFDVLVLLVYLAGTPCCRDSENPSPTLAWAASAGSSEDYSSVKNVESSQDRLERKLWNTAD